MVAAPGYHTLLFENEAVRVLEIRVVPGETAPLHTHRWPSTLYVLGWSDFVRRDAAGLVLMDSRVHRRLPERSTASSPSMPPHTFENVGHAEFHVISVEWKGVA